MDSFQFMDVRQMGAKGDGKADDAPAIQAALDHGGVVCVPPGSYLIGETLRIGSGTRLQAHPQAVFRFADGAGRDQHSHLLTNKDPEGGNTDIEVSGGIWDGNNAGNPRGGDLFAPGKFTGVMLQFRGVRGLRLCGLTLRDSQTYYLAMTGVEDFLVEHLRFESRNPCANNDGVHLGGCCERGIIRHLKGFGRHVPNDDMVALNADDAIKRLECQNMLCGPIRDIVIHDIQADQCHSFVRILSVDSPIENIDISHIRGGCSMSLLNMDGARQCRVPLFDADDPAYANGAGYCRRIRLSDVVVHKAAVNDTPLVRLFERTDDLEIRSLRRDVTADGSEDAPTFEARFIPGHHLRFEGLLAGQSDELHGTEIDRTTVSLSGQASRETVTADCRFDAGETLCLPHGDIPRLRVTGPAEVFDNGA